MVWRDLDANGRSDQDEMFGLADIGINSISVAATATDYEVAGNSILWEGAFTWDDGTSGLVGDAFFAGSSLHTVALVSDDFEYHRDAFDLPRFSGVGSLASSVIAFSDDLDLRQQAKDLVAQASAGDIAGFRAAFDDFILARAGTDSVQAGSRGAHIDARHIAFLEVVFDQAFPEGNPGPNAGGLLTDSINVLFDKLAIEFLEQVVVSNALLNSDSIDDYDAAIADHPLTGILNVSLSTAFERIVEEYVAGTFAIEDVKAILEIFETVSVDMATFNAELTEGVALSASSTAGLLYAILQGGATINVDGTAGDDSLSATGAAIFEGGIGDDALTGSSDSDIYVYSSGDGSDRIQETGAGNDTIVFSDLNIDDVTFAQNAGQDLVITAGTETITVSDQFRNSSEDIEAFVFADGTALDLAGISGKVDDDLFLI